MAMVAAGAGWSITTRPAVFSRAKQFQDQVQVHRFPGKSFARTLSIVSTPGLFAFGVDQVRKQDDRTAGRNTPFPRCTSNCPGCRTALR